MRVKKIIIFLMVLGMVFFAYAPQVLSESIMDGLREQVCKDTVAICRVEENKIRNFFISFQEAHPDFEIKGIKAKDQYLNTLVVRTCGSLEDKGYCFWYDLPLYTNMTQHASSSVQPPVSEDIVTVNPNDICPGPSLDGSGKFEGFFRECFSGEGAQDTCNSTRNLMQENGGAENEVRSVCVQGTCRGQNNVCFQYEKYEVGDKQECSDWYDLRYGSDNPADARDSDEMVASKNACEAKLLEYENSNPPRTCGAKVELIGRGQFRARRCFDATGLRKLTPEQVRGVRDRLQREAEAAALKKRQDAFEASVGEINKINFGGGEGGLLPSCNRTKEIVGPGGKTETIKAGCGWFDLVELANKIIKTVIWFAALIMILMILRAGWLLITAQGNVSKAGEARSALTKSIVGFCVVLCAWLIVNAVMNTLAKDYLQENSEVVDLLDE